MDITQAIETSNGKDLFSWFINQEHLPFDMSSDAYGTYLTLYNEFILELNKLFNEKRARYYWFTQNGRLISDASFDLISLNHIKVNEAKLRDIKLDEILK